MRKRRARHRGRTRHRAPRRPPLSPTTADRGARRRRYRRVVVAPLVLLLALAIAAVAASSTNMGPRSPRPLRAMGLTTKSTPLPPRRKVQLARREALALDRVLRYTPFVAAGTHRRRELALTFDDGPGPFTEPIVRILLRTRTPATFFIVGQQLAYFAAGLRDELRHRFVVGDHTQNHAWLARLAVAGQYSQIHDAGKDIERFGGSFPRLFRPPYGIYTPQTVGLLRRLRMLMVLWSIDPGDWRRPGTKAIVRAVLRNAGPGAIVILHDGGGDRSQTLAALPAIINGLRRRHYQLVSVPQLLLDDPPPRHQQLPELTGA